MRKILIKEISPEIEKNIRNEYYPGININSLVRKYSISKHLVNRIVRNNGNFRCRQKTLEEIELESEILKDYENPKMFINSIMNKYKISKSKLTRILQENKVVRDRNYRKNTFNENFFQKIDSPEKAHLAVENLHHR